MSTTCPSAAILLTDGFEEAEALIIVDVLRRLDVAVSTLACQENLYVRSYHDVQVLADARLVDANEKLFDAVILPGGPQGARSLGQNGKVTNFIRAHDKAGKLICPICSAGAHVLAANCLLHGRRYVCSGDNHLLYKDGTYIEQEIVRDGNIVSGRGLGLSFDFAFFIGALLRSPEVAYEQARHIYTELRPFQQTAA